MADEAVVEGGAAAPKVAAAAAGDKRKDAAAAKPRKPKKSKKDDDEEYRGGGGERVQRPRRQRKNKKDDDDEYDDGRAYDGSDSDDEPRKLAKSIDDVPEKSKTQALHRLLAVIGDSKFPPETAEEIADLAKEWELDIEREDGEVFKYKLFRFRHIYDEATTQRLVKDAKIHQWIANARANL